MKVLAPVRLAALAPALLLAGAPAHALGRATPDLGLSATVATMFLFSQPPAP